MIISFTKWQPKTGQWECTCPLSTSQTRNRFMWSLPTSAGTSSAAPWSGPLNYALHMLCATRHWSFEHSCLVRRLVIRQKDLVKCILWNYSNALCIWNYSSRIIYVEKGTFKYSLSLFLNFCFSPLFTDISCISWTFANCRASLLFWYGISFRFLWAG